MVAWVVIYRRHFTLSVPCEGLGPAGPFALPLSTPLSPLPHLSTLLPYTCALFCAFLHSPKTQSFSFHTVPHSFPKNKGWPYFQQMLSPDPKSFRIRIS